MFVNATAKTMFRFAMQTEPLRLAAPKGLLPFASRLMSCCCRYV